MQRKKGRHDTGRSKFAWHRSSATKLVSSYKWLPLCSLKVSFSTMMNLGILGGTQQGVSSSFLRRLPCAYEISLFFLAVAKTIKSNDMKIENETRDDITFLQYYQHAYLSSPSAWRGKAGGRANASPSLSVFRAGGGEGAAGCLPEPNTPAETSPLRLHYYFTSSSTTERRAKRTTTSPLV